MNRKSFEFDSLTFTLFVIIGILGFLTVYAVSSDGGDASYFDLDTAHGRQLIWMAISLGCIVLISFLDFRLIIASSYFLYGFTILVLILTLFIGREINGAKSWLFIGGQSIQPSEFAKMTTAMALASFMSANNFNLKNQIKLLTAVAIVALPALIVILQNDTGSALVFGSFIIIFYREGINPLVLVVLILSAAAALLSLGLDNPWLVRGIIVGMGVFSFLIFQNKRQFRKILFLHIGMVIFLLLLGYSTRAIVDRLPVHQQNRIMVLFDPGTDPLGKGYNVIQSKIAIGSGGFTGKGFLDGLYTKNKFVPKQETDFIYCTIGEEGGWIGSSFIIILFFLLLWRIHHVAENSKTRYARVYGYAVLSIIFFHTVINIGMTVGLVPVIGIPLPMFSYGGSAILSFSLLMGVLINLHSHRVSVLVR